MLQSSANPSTLGQVVTLTAVVTPPEATGKVTFYDGVALLGTSTLANGSATLSTVLLSAGNHALRAYYGGNATLAPVTSSTLPQTVNAIPVDGFTKPTVYPAGLGPYFMAAADFNRDGKLDLVVADRDSAAVYVLLGNGDGTFLAAVKYDAGTRAWSLAVGDVNGDGKADVVVADASKTVSVLLGNGDGTLQAALKLQAGSTPNSVAIGDFNQDGRADLAVANYGDNSIGIFLGNGDGTFQAAVNYDAGGTPYFVAVGDFNRDGEADLAVTNFDDNTISILLGNGDGSFQTAHAYRNGDAFHNGNGPASIAVADFNGDGNPDLAVTGRGTIGSIFLGNGDGTFQAALNAKTGVDSITVSVADVNADGKPDLVVANESTVQVSILLGNGDGTFQPAEEYLTGGVHVYSAVAGDFNGDGKPDLAVTGSPSVSVLLGTTLLPDLTITETHTGVFLPGQSGATFTVTVSNSGTAATSGKVLVTPFLPTGLTLTAMSGNGWSCAPNTNTCTRSEVLGIGMSYPPIVLTVDVASSANSRLPTTTSVVGGGETNVGNSTAYDVALVSSQYVVGDVYPSAGDVLGSFGDSEVNVLDLISILRAVTGTPGFTPAACSDRFDAMDVWPQDTPGQRGGDGVIDTLDLLAAVRRVTNVDTSRPMRSPRGGCSEIKAQGRREHPSDPASAEAVLRLGASQRTANGWRSTVFLQANVNLDLAGLSFSMGTMPLHFVPSAEREPTLIDQALRGQLALAYLDRCQLKAGEVLELGFVETALLPRALEILSVTANAADGRSVTVFAVRGNPEVPRRNIPK